MFSLRLSAYLRILIALSLTEKSSSSWIPWFSSTEKTSTSTLDKNNKIKHTRDFTTQSRRLLSINDITETFKPLTCTPSSWNCAPWKFGLDPSNVVIPCDECYTLEEYTNNEIISINGTLNIIGKLEIPNGSKVTIKTTGIIVQGELDIVSSKIIDGTPDITIQLLGDDDTVTFTPDSTNSQVCSGPCELGAKPFVVAGGKVDIRGMPDTNCRTWTTIKDFTTGGKPTPMNIPKWQSTDTCHDSTILSEDFENGLADWYGNAGTNEVLNTHEDSINSGRYLNIANRVHEYQGPMLNLPKDTRECIQPDTDYFFKAMIRIKPGPDHGAATSECHLSQTNCPKLQFSNMEGTGIVRWTELIIMDNSALGFAIKDNEWFEVKRAIRLDTTKTKINPSNIFSFFSINGVEAGIDIALDNVSITPPPPEAFPSTTDTCGELVVNGGADSLDGFPHPAHIYTGKIDLMIKEENGNPYFSVAGRSRVFDAFALDLTHGCLQTGAVYSFSSRIRIHSNTDTKAQIAIASKATGGTVALDFVQKACNASSTDIGWITCTGEFTVPDHLSQPKETVRLTIFTQNTELADIDIDDVSFQFKMSGGGGIELQDKENIINCWAPGSDFLIPSNDLKFDRVQVGKFLAINSTGFVKSTTELDRVTTAMDDSNFATELALLSRNIRFEGKEGEKKNPSFIVLNTPNIMQIVEGVDFDGFGQEQVVAHHPISFVMSGNSGSIVSKNTIRNSMNRCINLKGSNNMVVDGNVAYKTRGHCFAVGSDSTGNTFSKNIGAVTQNAINVIDGQTDNFASTFHIAHPSNIFVGNHAAGSENNGIWFNLPLLQSTLDISTFASNTLHSNKVGIKTYPFGLLSAKTTTWANIKSYRSDTGISFLKSKKHHSR